MASFEASTAEEAIIKAAVSVCKPCCGGCTIPGCSVIETCCCCWHCGENRLENPSNVDGFTGPMTLTVTIDVDCLGTRTIDCDLVFCGCDGESVECDGPDSSNEGYDTIEWYGVSGTTVAGTCNHCDGMSPPVIWPATPIIVATVRCKRTAFDRQFEIDFAVYSATANMFGTQIPLTNINCSPFSASAATEELGATCIPGVPGGLPYTTCENCVGSAVSIEVTE